MFIRSAMLAIIPLLLAGATCSAQAGDFRKYDSTGNKVTFNSVKLEMSKGASDTMIIQDQKTGKNMTKIVKLDTHPVKINGKNIYDNPAKKPAFKIGKQSLRDYLVHTLGRQLDALEDGVYMLNVGSVLIDENGKVAYFEYKGISGKKIPQKGQDENAVTVVKVPFNIQQRLYEAVTMQMSTGMAFTPGMNDGKKVPCLVTYPEFMTPFKVEHHMIFDKDIQGTYVPVH